MLPINNWYINSFLKQAVSMKDKSNKPDRAIPKEMRMVNREYDEIVFEPSDVSSPSDKKRSKNSKNK